MKKFLGTMILLALASAGSVAMAQDAPRGELIDRIVAVVNENVIMESELEAEVRQMRQAMQGRGASLPPENAFRRQVLDRMIAVELQKQFAQRAGIRVSDDRVNQAVTEIARRNNLNLSELPAFLAREGINYAEFREQVRDEILLSEVQQAAVDQRITVSPREVEEFLERQQRGGEGREYLASHILITVPGEAPPEAIEEAREHIDTIRNRIVSGEASFAEMAATYSQGQRALEGGSLGWRRVQEIPTLLADAVVDLAAGEVSQPIRSGSGWHLVRVDEIRGEERVVATETHARHILLKPNALRDETATMALARRLKMRIQAGEDFATLAKEFSEDPGSAVQGGDLGWVPPGVFAPRFQDVLDGMQPNEISEPFQTQFGIHVAEVLGRRDTDFTETVAQNRAFQTIKRRKSEEQFPIWLQNQHDNAHIDIRLES